MRAKPEAVVLLAGLWMPWWAMLPLRRRLRRAGFAAHILRYRSLRENLHASAARLQRFAGRLDADTVHYVAHSLGGVVVRSLFHDSPPRRPGRIVSLGSPLLGSCAGERMARSRIGRLLTGAGVAEVVAGEPQEWVAPDRDWGAIAGNLPLGLAIWVSALHAPHDGVVAVDEALPSWATDRCTVHRSHTGMLAAADVARQVCRFLETGSFGPPPSAAENGV